MTTGMYTVTLDRTPHDSKPEGREIGAITKRLEKAGPSEITFDDLKSVILAGGSFCSGCYKPSFSGWGEFIGIQTFVLDFDNTCSDRDTRNKVVYKRDLMPGENGYLDPLDALDRCSKLHVQPLMLYFSFSASAEPWRPKYHVVFDAGELITDEKAAQKYLSTLHMLFPEADHACTNLNRVWFGGLEVIDCRGGVWS